MSKNRTLDDLASETRRRYPKLVRLWRWLRHGKNDWRRTCFLWALSLLAAYLAVVPRTISYSAQFVIKGTHQREVWEYVADFANMPKLNPTIIKWSLEEESGNFDHWRYKVRYEEYLSNLPWVRNTAEALVEVIAPPARSPLERKHGHEMADDGPYLIKSKHETCFYGHLFCVPTRAEFHFSKASENGLATLCTEKITTTCAPLLYFFCLSEIRHQRKTIQTGLLSRFAT